MARRNHELQTIHSEGGLLPPDLLRRVLDRKTNLVGTQPEYYGLPAGERLNEVITQSWNRLRKHWAEFCAAAANLPETEAGTGLTNDRWNLPLLRELGFGLLPTSPGPEIGGRTYAISRFFGPVPVHLIGCNLSLDRRAAGQRGAAAANPHGLVQEFLNRSDSHLWALLSNGLRLRILRDNQALSRQSFLEFDLESMMSGEVYSDFVLLWLTAHATRFAPSEGERPETCWLEHWTQDAEEQGTRALGELRRSVEQALAVLGEGFTGHPTNTALRDALRSSALSPTDLHAQLLRLVYRLIFLFVAEDRSLEGQPLIHPLDNSSAAHAARERYGAHYGAGRLREMAGKIKGTRHGDLWRQFQILLRALSGDPESEAIRRALALPALGSFLWDPASTPDLNDAELTNFDLLEALRHLAFTRQGKVLRAVDYKNLGAEELGGVYESLLALTPQVSGDGARFSFAEFAGNERKTSGSYYTPDTLVQCLLDSALDPVVEEAIKGKRPAEAEEAILALKVCDPAVGSGHFLVGAAHRLARHLARVRALAEGESEPSPLLYQHALRDVIGRCLYGVDMNPMAAELCRVSLWLEALEPGKPLSFLDHHIRVGNSLLGTTPELIAGGLPDDAFKPVEGDDKKVCAALKKRNKQERDGKQMDLGLRMVAEARAEYDTLASRSQRIDQARDDDLEAIERKAEQFRRLVVSAEYRHQQLIADAWCAAFIWPKSAKTPSTITTDTIRRLEVDDNELDTAQREELERLSEWCQFFHWKLAFPEVFAQGGFDCVLGNPPWEKINLSVEEFFAIRAPAIMNAPTKAARRRRIEDLKQSDPDCYRDYQLSRRFHDFLSVFFRFSGRYPLTGISRVNLYSIFAELDYLLVGPSGRVGVVIASGIATDDNNRHFFNSLIKNGQLISIRDFENRERIFPDIDSRYRFCLLTYGGNATRCESPRFAFYLKNPGQVEDVNYEFQLTGADINRINPITGTCPIFRGAADSSIALHVYRRFLTSGNHSSSNGWPGSPLTAFNVSNDSGLFVDAEDIEQVVSAGSGNRGIHKGQELLPLYEAKHIWQFDHRWATHVLGGIEEVGSSGKADPTRFVSGRFWLRNEDVHARFGSWTHNWQVGYRRVSAPTNERTAVCSIIPNAAISYTITLLRDINARESVLVTACMNSFAFDYLTRQKVSGADFTISVFKQLPFPSRKQLETISSSVIARSLELSYTAHDLSSVAEECGWDGPPFRWDEERRFLIRCELDAAFFHIYLPADESGGWRPARKVDGCAYDETPAQLEELKRHFPTPRDAVDYIMDSFPIVHRKDEKAHGECRAKRVILEIYDAMQEAARSGEQYETRLDPAPGPPLDVNGNFVSYAYIAANPPPHIHLPRDAMPTADIPLQVSDLIMRFPDAPFRLRLNTGADVSELRVIPVPTSALGSADTVVIACPQLRYQGEAVPVAIGRLRVESRIDANDGSSYVLVSVRGDDGLAQARFPKDEWRKLLTVGVVEDGAPTEAADG